jgi:hypothetical protein
MITDVPESSQESDRSTHRVHLEPDQQHHHETTPSGGGSTSSGAQHTPVSQCGSAVRDKVLLSCRNHPHGQPNSCKLMSFIVLFTTILICSQFALDPFNLFLICYQFFHFVFNSLNLCSIFSICSEFVLNFVNQFSIHLITVNFLKLLSLFLVSHIERTFSEPLTKIRQNRHFHSNTLNTTK